MEVLFVLGGLESRKSTKIDFCNFFLSVSDRSIQFFYFCFRASSSDKILSLDVNLDDTEPRQGQIVKLRLRDPTISTGTSVVVKYIYKATSIGAFCLVSFFSPKDVATKYITYYIGITYKCSSQNGLLLRREGNRRKIRD